MRFIERIEAKDNILLSSLNDCKESGYKTYIWGNGWIANEIEKRNLFDFDGRLVNRMYYSEGLENVFCFEDILENEVEKINILVGFLKFDYSLIDKYKEKINVFIFCDYTNGNPYDSSVIFSRDLIESNEDKLEEIYVSLADEKSRLSLLSYINQKISSDYKYLRNVYEGNQYFPRDIIVLGNDEVFVDCGAFIGDTAEEFVSQIKKTSGSYKKIISFEPDPINYRTLNSKGLLNHTCLNMGTSDHKDVIRFLIDESSSCFCDEGNAEVEVNSIDNVIDDDVTYIKMDIEGMELVSLMGAEETIKRCKPKLAICIYHKFEDLWEIQNYIKSIVPDYKFYIRAHEPFALELVLYAVR